MYLGDHEWPVPHHPVATDPDGDGLVADAAVTAEVFQLRPLNVEACTAWCGGRQVLINGGPAVLLPDGGVVGLGDYVVHRDGRYSAVPADGFAQRYQFADQ